jgi:DNA-directed RNA polymerase subunit H (RpoH/RPB5)
VNASASANASTELSVNAPVRGVIFVSEKRFKHFVISELASYRHTYPSIQIEEVRWDIFLFEIPLHNANCPHTIVDPVEIEDYLSRTYTDPIFKKIRTADPQAIWIGARAGDVVKIDMTSFSAGVAVDYRICEDV